MFEISPLVGRLHPLALSPLGYAALFADGELSGLGVGSVDVLSLRF